MMHPNRTLSSRRQQLALLTAAVAASIGSQAVSAQTVVTWTGATGAFVDPANWNPSLVPSVAGDIFAAINNGGTATVDAGDSAEAADLVLGLEPAQSGHLAISDGTLTLGDLHVGGRKLLFDEVTPNPGGTGSVVQSGGVVNINATAPSGIPKQSLFIGDGGLADGNSATGSYTLNAGQLNVGTSAASILSIGSGAGSLGTFTQKPGTSVSVTGRISVGRTNSVGDNLYLMEGGTLNVSTEIDVGGAGTSAASRGTFTQSDGDITIGTNLVIGFAAGGFANTGTYNLDGGTLTHPRSSAQAILAVGNGSGGVGTFTQTAGTLNITNRVDSIIDVGRGGAATGFYTMTGGTMNTKFFRLTNNAANRADFAGGTSTTETLRLHGGILTISGGSHSFTGIATIDTTGTLVLSGGAPSFTGTLILGTGSTVRTSIPLSIAAPITLGNTTIDVEADSLTLAGGITSTAARTLTKTGPGTLTLSGPQAHVAGSAFTNNAGTLNLNNPGHANLTVNANAGSTNFLATDTTLAALNVADGATATLPPSGRTLTTNALNLNSSGTLDLANNSLTINDPGFDVRSRLQSAFNNGAWDQPGLTSSTARDRADNGAGLGWVNTGSQIDVLYTWAGDLNLDKQMNGDDFTLIDRHVAINGFGAAATWQQGDVNYDGIVTVDDYVLVDTGFAAASGAPLSASFLSMRQSQFGDAYVAQLLATVPEPSLAAALFALPLVSRRRRK